MKLYSIISILMLLIITACNSNTSESEQVKELPSQEEAVVQYMTPGQKSIHLFNLPEGVSEEQLSTSLSEMNAAISELGYPGAGYHMYKVESDTIQEYRYFMEGLWPDAEAYRIIHESDNWKQAAEKNSEMTKKLFSGPIYLYRRLSKVEMGE